MLNITGIEEIQVKENHPEGGGREAQGDYVYLQLIHVDGWRSQHNVLKQLSPIEN